MTTTHSRAESLTLTAVAATMQAADLEAPVAACCGTCYWWYCEDYCSYVEGGTSDRRAWLDLKPSDVHLNTEADFACNQWQAKE